MKLTIYALLLFLALPAQAAKVVSEIRLDLNGDEQPDLVRIMDYGQRGDSLEIFFAGQARPFSFDKIVKNSRSFGKERPAAADYSASLEKLSETSFRIKGIASPHFNRSTHYDRIDITMRDGTLDLDYFSEEWRISTGDHRAYDSKDYDFVKRHAMHSQYDSMDEGKETGETREIPAGCQPQLVDLNASGIPYCARF